MEQTPRKWCLTQKATGGAAHAGRYLQITMDKKPKLLLSSIAIYIGFCGLYIAFQLAMSIYRNTNQNFDDIAMLFVALAPAIIGLILSYFTIKRFTWARIVLGMYSGIGVIFVLFLPIAQHGIDRTLLFYFICLLAIFVLGLLAFSLLLHENTIRYLDNKR